MKIKVSIMEYILEYTRDVNHEVEQPSDTLDYTRNYR